MFLRSLSCRVICKVNLLSRGSIFTMSKSQHSVTFDYGLSTSDPETSPVLIVGQVPHLKALKWDDVRRKLEPRVTELVWNRALNCVTNSPGDKVELWPRGAMLASLPLRCSRHVGSARGYALSKIVKEHRMGTNVHIVLVCRKTAVFASAAAIARALPAFSARSCLASLSSANQPPPAPPEARVEVFLINERIGYDPEDGDNEYLSDSTLTSEDFVALTELAHGVRMAARITDMPCNMCDVDTMIQEATKVAQELNIKPPTVIRGEELRDRGFGGIYGVGKAAASPPALVVLSWTHEAATETVAWVGKGIVYDTGGLSLKSRLAMVGMKSDCGGAAAVLGAFRSFVCHQPTLNLHAVLCVAENAVGPNATRPDDIHTLYSGRTVEINNTDAEGRLVLSDGVVYAHKDLGATTIVDVATLTGVQGTATGKYHAAIVSNCERMEAAAVRAGRACGDLAHPLPFAPELHFCEFSSSVADMTNSVADRGNAQPSCAGLFILAHLGFDFPGTWLHVDMAAPAHAGDRATGYGVALLSVLFGKYANNKLLRNLNSLF